MLIISKFIPKLRFAWLLISEGGDDEQWLDSFFLIGVFYLLDLKKKVLLFTVQYVDLHSETPNELT